MIIYVDADACPVQDEIIQIAKDENIHVILVKSYSHYSNKQLPNHVQEIYVDKGSDMADFKIVQLIQKDDIVITQDYGLASLCLQNKCHVIHHNGFQYTSKNINRLLASRHESAMARRAGKRTRGPKPYSNENKKAFIKLLTNIIKKIYTVR